ncbi:MAG: cryptochrome/photolyase family protein [Alsobacter sp.]
MPRPAVVWFRDDLRLADNPALTAASAADAAVIAVYVFDPQGEPRVPGAASRWWLHGALEALAADLAAHGVPLLTLQGPQRETMIGLIDRLDAASVHWSRRYEAGGIAIDSALKAHWRSQGRAAHSHKAALLHEPWEVRGRAGDPLRVFTPFWRAARATGEPHLPLPVPAGLRGARLEDIGNLGVVPLAALGLRPTRPDWAGGLRAAWTPGEAGARRRCDAFLATGLDGYGDGRNRPDRPMTSALSPYLRFGHISPRQLWHAAGAAVQSGASPASHADMDKFRAELGWREFSYSLLFNHTALHQRSVQPRFDAFPWRDDPAGLRAWQRGLTGYPLVDAGMRQLWTTGWMHNRVRMVAASFLIKHLLVDWRLGEDWFWDTLVDADPASNPASWQWVAGSGADAAPYYRIFNPVLQGETYDPQGDYVRRYVPELDRLPAPMIHRPWTATPAELRAAGVVLDETYPRPIVDHAAARARALAALETLKPNADFRRINVSTRDQ